MARRLVWFLLVDGEGQAFRGMSADKVQLPSDGDVDTFRKHLHAKHSTIFEGIVPAQLVVYAGQKDFDDGNALEEDEKIVNRGTDKANALVVLVPAVCRAISPRLLKTSYDLLQLVLPHALINAPTSLSASNQDFKHILCQFYGCYRQRKRRIHCMVLDLPFPKAVVNAVHLFRRSNEYLAFPMMQINDIDDPKNGMLMFKPLKYAFDKFQISFIAEEDGNSFQLKLFDISIQNTRLIDFITDSDERQVVVDTVSIVKPKKRFKYNLQTTFGEIDGKRITFYSPNRPYNRCLNLHARLAYMIALKKGSIDPSYQFKDFWAEGMSLEDKMNIFHRSISALNSS
jgi:hypothetical protein